MTRAEAKAILLFSARRLRDAVEALDRAKDEHEEAIARVNAFDLEGSDRPSRVPCQVCHGAGTCMLCDDDGMVPIECEVTT